MKVFFVQMVRTDRRRDGFKLSKLMGIGHRIRCCGSGHRRLLNVGRLIFTGRLIFFWCEIYVETCTRVDVPEYVRFVCFPHDFPYFLDRDNVNYCAGYCL